MAENTDFARWRFEVRSVDPKTGRERREKCMGISTAEHLAIRHKQAGRERVKLITRRRRM